MGSLPAVQRPVDARDVEALGGFLAEDVTVSGQTQGLGGYAEGLKAMVAAFPDHRWGLRHLLVEGHWIFAHLVVTGTHRGAFHGAAATGPVVSTQAFALHRVQAGRIAEVFVTAGDMCRTEQVR